MTDIDARIAALLAVPERAPDVAFANEAALRLKAERTLDARLAAERWRTATLLVATLAVAAGLWLFAHSEGFVAATGGSFGGLAALAAVMVLWCAFSAPGTLAGD